MAMVLVATLGVVVGAAIRVGTTTAIVAVFRHHVGGGGGFRHCHLVVLVGEVEVCTYVKVYGNRMGVSITETDGLKRGNTRLLCRETNVGATVLWIYGTFGMIVSGNERR